MLLNLSSIYIHRKIVLYHLELSRENEAIWMPCMIYMNVGLLSPKFVGQAGRLVALEEELMLGS